MRQRQLTLTPVNLLHPSNEAETLIGVLQFGNIPHDVRDSRGTAWCHRRMTTTRPKRLRHLVYRRLATVPISITEGHISIPRVAIGIFRANNGCVVIDNTTRGVDRMTLIEYHCGRKIANALPEAGWRTSTRCVPNANCAEINRGRSDRVGVRDSKHPIAASTLEFPPSAWTRFLDQLRSP
jgi:hypothetical protein